MGSDKKDKGHCKMEKLLLGCGKTLFLSNKMLKNKKSRFFRTGK